MDYGRVYEQFIEDRRNKPVPVKGEQHHILPRCLGGGDEPENIIRLSYADHLFAHVLLARIHGGSLLFAVSLMLHDDKYRGRRSRAWFSRVRGKWLEACSARTKGKPQKPEHLANRSVAMRGNKNTLGYKQSPEHIEKRIKRGWKHSPEAIQRMREIALNRHSRTNQ
jgi:hypothetical protein